MGSRSFQGQNGLFRSVLGFSGILEWLEDLGAKGRGFCKVWEFLLILGEFFGVWSG
jgi:hypothetical protein